MSRLPLIDPAADSPAKALLERTKAQLGRIPNLYRAMANAPAALDGYLSFRMALQSGRLSPHQREQIALLVAELNGCNYCVSAHMFRGDKLGIPAAELACNRRAESSDPRSAAVLSLATDVLVHRGAIDDAVLEDARRAGISDEEITEIVAHVALNVFSNFFNHVARPELDFPLVEAGAND